MMSETDRGQVSRSAAEVYEEFFVPALFQQWTGRVADEAGIRPGDRVLDVACGTGVLARHLASRVGPSGSVSGVDINDGMLAVARRQAPAIEWRKGAAEALPFDDASFDAVVSQFGLMFFADRVKAVREMIRALRQSGRLAVAVWDLLDNTPGYAAMTGLLQQLFGGRAADALRAPYALGNPRALTRLFTDAGCANVRIATHEGTARFASIEAWVHTDVKGWTLADMIDDLQYSLLLTEAKTKLREFVAVDGTVAFRAPAHIVTATKSVDAVASTASRESFASSGDF
jgi:SAM-dependent methyltransferase